MPVLLPPDISPDDVIHSRNYDYLCSSSVAMFNSDSIYFCVPSINQSSSTLDLLSSKVELQQSRRQSSVPSPGADVGLPTLSKQIHC